jgi:hypothetical protein
MSKASIKMPSHVSLEPALVLRACRASADVCKVRGQAGRVVVRGDNGLGCVGCVVSVLQRESKQRQSMDSEYGCRCVACCNVAVGCGPNEAPLQLDGALLSAERGLAGAGFVAHDLTALVVVTRSPFSRIQHVKRTVHRIHVERCISPGA